MPANSLDEFKSNFHGGTRRNRFEINGAITGGGGALTTYHAYAFSLPQIGIGEIPVDYRGRRLYIPGDRDYPQWTLTILDDAAGAGSQIYHGFQEWQRQINDHVENGQTDILVMAIVSNLYFIVTGINMQSLKSIIQF